MPLSGGQSDPRLASLLDALSAADNAEQAAPIEARIWALWTSSGETETDQLMALGWKVLLPLSIVNILVTGFVMLLVRG